MIKRLIVLSVYVLSFFSFINVFGQTLGIADYRTVVSKIKNIKRYSYTTTTTAVFPDGKSDVLTTATFMDIPKMNYTSKSKIEQVVMNNKWFYRVNHRQKYVSVFDLKRYSSQYPGVAGDLSFIFKSSLATDFLDSVIASGGKLKIGKREGNILVFEFEFDKEAPLKKLILKFNEAKGLPEYVYMHTEFRANNGKLASTKIVCDHYSDTFSDLEFKTDDLFSIIGGKVSLLKYKNYKISSSL